MAAGVKDIDYGSGYITDPILTGPIFLDRNYAQTAIQDAHSCGLSR